MPSASIPAAMIGADVAAGSSTLAAASAADAVASFGTATVVASQIPFSLATAATIGSSAVSALGSIAQSRASAASAGYNAKVAANNATIATQNANFTGAEGEQNVGAAGAATKAKVAATLANQAGSGIDVNSGSAVDVRESEAKLGMLNALNIRSQATRQAYGFQTQSASDTGQSELLRKQQVSDEVGGYLGAGSSVLGGVGKASQYANWLNNNGLIS